MSLLTTYYHKTPLMIQTWNWGSRKMDRLLLSVQIQSLSHVLRTYLNC